MPRSVPASLMALLCALALGGCDDTAPIGERLDAGDGPPPIVDRGGLDGTPDGLPFDGALPDVALPDTALTDGPPIDAAPLDGAPMDAAPLDGAPPDAAPDAALPDAMPPDAASAVVPGAPGVVAGGARRSSPRFRLTATVGGPSPAAARQSPRYRARVGVGIPSVSTPGAP